MNAAFAQAQAAKAAEESALAALSDSERRCQDGLRRMDSMLADTKELTRELAKHKHLAKGMDDMVRRHERRMLRSLEVQFFCTQRGFNLRDVEMPSEQAARGSPGLGFVRDLLKL
ncbi:unnamed protein product [Symbiodinium natans]|uniref:Uncharacterized protein n=1 Tax=Symbiodinium natans TaxID=878477 RepID=A0A812J4J9_9DINO|nr:unnamed protein product [Symbiodinium natans]